MDVIKNFKKVGGATPPEEKIVFFEEPAFIGSQDATLFPGEIARVMVFRVGRKGKKYLYANMRATKDTTGIWSDNDDENRCYHIKKDEDTPSEWYPIPQNVIVLLEGKAIAQFEKELAIK